MIERVNSLATSLPRKRRKWKKKKNQSFPGRVNQSQADHNSFSITTEPEPVLPELLNEGKTIHSLILSWTVNKDSSSIILNSQSRLNSLYSILLPFIMRRKMNELLNLHLFFQWMPEGKNLVKLRPLFLLSLTTQTPYSLSELRNLRRYYLTPFYSLTFLLTE